MQRQTKPSYIEIHRDYKEYQAFRGLNNIPHPNMRSANIPDEMWEALKSFPYITGVCNGVPFVSRGNEIALQGDGNRLTEVNRQFVQGVQTFLLSQLLCHEWLYDYKKED